MPKVILTISVSELKFIGSLNMRHVMTTFGLIQAVSISDHTKFSGPQICYIKNNFDKCFVVTAEDNFLSGWGPAEDKKAFQVVLCFDEKQAIKVAATMKSIKEWSFKNVKTHSLMHFLDVANGLFGKNVSTLKNANRAEAWNQGYTVPVDTWEGKEVT